MLGPGWVEPIVAPPSPRHIAAQLLLALCLQERQIGVRSWRGWWGSLGIFDEHADAILAYLCDEGYFERDGDLLHIGPEAERKFAANCAWVLSAGIAHNLASRPRGPGHRRCSRRRGCRNRTLRVRQPQPRTAAGTGQEGEAGTEQAHCGMVPERPSHTCGARQLGVAWPPDPERMRDFMVVDYPIGERTVDSALRAVTAVLQQHVIFEDCTPARFRLTEGELAERMTNLLVVCTASIFG